MKVLLHACCANCAIFPVKTLRSEGVQPSALFFNPNIHPYQEFARRLDAMRIYADRAELSVLFREEYALEEFLAAVADRPQSRCDFCYRVRLEETARMAAREGFDAFTTTLLYSRHQQHDKIRALGEEVATRHSIAFLYRDFRSGWQEGINTSKAMGLYRQQYCGCIYSEKDRYAPRRPGSPP